VGTYQLIETYSDSTGHFLGSSAIGTLSISAPSPALPAPPPPPPLLQVAALEVALDWAALALQGNPGALLQLQVFSDVFLHYQIPATIPELMGAIQSLYPQTGVLGLDAIQAGQQAINMLKNNPPS
jgi:hypothetical protein